MDLGVSGGRIMLGWFEEVQKIVIVINIIIIIYMLYIDIHFHSDKI